MKSACMKVGLALVLFLYTMTGCRNPGESLVKVVSSEDAKPLAGVSVSVKGKTATQTDANGQYAI
jgi:hypothetical protein